MREERAMPSQTLILYGTTDGRTRKIGTL